MTLTNRLLADRLALVDTLDHLLAKGAVLSGEATISVAGIDLVYLGVKVLLSSVENLPFPLEPEGPARPRPSLSGPVLTEPLGPGGTERSRMGVLAPERPRAAISGHGSEAGSGEEHPERGLAQLVLTLVELLRQVVERQALRRMEGGSLTDEEVERMGQALSDLEQKMAELREAFGLASEDLDIDLGPLGSLL